MHGNKRPLLPSPETAAAAGGGGELSRPRKRWRTVVLAMREEMYLREVFGRRESTGTVSFRRLLQVRLVSMVKTVVSEEVGRALAILHAPPRLIPSYENHPNFELRFLDKVRQPVYTSFKVERDNAPSGQDTGLRVAIYSKNNNHIITRGHLASAEIEVSVLPGEFRQNNRENRTEKHFENAALVDRKNKPPILMAKHTFRLKNGEATIDWLVFGDNSSWTRDKMFRVGIRVLNCEEVQVKEAITEPFPVRDRRMEARKKHYPPVSSDEIWRLEGIGMNGDRCKLLNKKGIKTVKNLLDAYYMNEAELRTNLGGLSEASREWKTIIKHAKTCSDYWRDCNNGALDQSDQLTEIRRNNTYVHGSSSSQQHPFEHQIINRSNEVIAGFLRQISSFEGHNYGSLLNSEVTMDEQINPAPISVMAANNGTYSVNGGIQNQDLFDICPAALPYMPERSVPPETTVGPRFVGSSSSASNPSENNAINRGLSPLIIPEGPDLEDILANTEPSPNNYSGFQQTSRSDSFNAGSCEELVQGFLASMSSSSSAGNAINSLTPRSRVRTVFMAISFLASPRRKKARKIVPSANQTLQLSC